jgi:UDP-glucose 4-epimerase
MNIIVTGAAGFIGSHVAEILVGRGHRVLGLDDLSGGFPENIPDGVDFERRSVNDPLDELFAAYRPEVVYHLAAYAAEGLSHHIPVFNYQNNLLATANVLSAGYRAGIRHFVFTSSIAAYGHPQNGEVFDEEMACHPCDPYGVAKVACEQHIRGFAHYYGVPHYTIFRPHNVFGPRQNIADPYRNVVGIFMKAALAGEAMLIFGDGSQTRSFSYITSVASAIADAPFLAGAVDKTFNIGGDKPWTVRELARHVCDVMAVPERLEFLPPRNEVAHAHCNHRLAREVFAGAFELDVDVATGLTLMADFVRRTKIPPSTECPCPVEISNGMPPSWLRRLSQGI